MVSRCHCHSLHYKTALVALLLIVVVGTNVRTSFSFILKPSPSSLRLLGNLSRGRRGGEQSINCRHDKSDALFEASKHKDSKDDADDDRGEQQEQLQQQKQDTTTTTATKQPLPSSSSATALPTTTSNMNSTTTNRLLRPNSMAAATAQYGKVPYGESSRIYRRTVYSTSQNWVDHRGGFGIVQNLRGLFFSGVIRQLKDEVLLVTAVAALVVLWNGLVLSLLGGQLQPQPQQLQQHMMILLTLPSAPFTLSSPALGLLLVFRTNASYGRWMEARMQWSKIHTHCINLIRMAATFVDASQPLSQEALSRLVQTTWLVPRTLMHRFSRRDGGNGSDDGDSDQQDEDDVVSFAKEIEEMFGSSNDRNSNDNNNNMMIDNILKAHDPPTAALMELSLALDALPIDEKRRLEIDKSVIILGEAIAACERIFSSPVPLVYTRHTVRFLSLWMLLLPLSLYDFFVPTAMTTIPITTTTATAVLVGKSAALLAAVAMLSIFLFGISELSVQLEEPFSILPMSKFCEDIKIVGGELRDRAIHEAGGRRPAMATNELQVG